MNFSIFPSLIFTYIFVHCLHPTALSRAKSPFGQKNKAEKIILFPINFYFYFKFHVIFAIIRSHCGNNTEEETHWHMMMERN
jgi:hypothetical protein